MDPQFINRIYRKHQETERYPPTSEIFRLITKILLILFPEQTRKSYRLQDEIAFAFAHSEKDLCTILNTMKQHLNGEVETVASSFMRQIPIVYEKLLKDVQAIVNGDPAAKSEYEVIRAYPGFYAIAFYRLANVLYKLEVPLLPRVLTEFAHSRTGIDIHPGAEIEPYFFIDHGTGTTIGETAIIGENVKLYQGVTLGALSVTKDQAQVKRHPTIEDNVIIYSGATILGGQTIIGHHSIIGGNVWITKSTLPYTTVYHKPQIKMSVQIENY